MKGCIYTTEVQGDKLYEMEGIFIYTASPDSEGSLGGLVSQGRGSNIENTIIKTLDKSRWCSSDPLCIQSGGQGLNSLNLAACHSCALLACIRDGSFCSANEAINRTKSQSTIKSKLNEIQRVEKDFDDFISCRTEILKNIVINN